MIDKTAQNDPKTEDDKAPESARESIRAAVAEHREKEQKALKAQELDPIKKEEVKEPVVDPVKKEEPKEVKESVVEPVKKEEPKVDDIKVDDKVEPVGDVKKSKAPFGLPKNVRSKFDSADPEIQEYLGKLVKETMDIKANEGRRAPMRDVEQVLAPLLPEMQQIGVSPAQFVKRLVDYTYALAHPQAKYNAIAQLAHDYQIDLTLFGAEGVKNKDDNKVEQTVDNIPPELTQKLDTIINRFSQLETTHKSDNEKVALDTINTWAGYDPATKEFKSRPFFPVVRQTMHSLIASGTVPLKDGKIDLDGAYDAACFAHPEVRDYIMEEQGVKMQTEQLRQQQAQQQQVIRAKNAGSSLRPGAPALRSPNTVTSKLNSKGQPLTVRDSLRQAIAQMREAQ